MNKLVAPLTWASCALAPTAVVILTLLPLALAGCSKSSPDLSPAPRTNSVYQDRLAKIITRSTNAELEFTHQHAHNFQPEIATGTQPYGSGYSEYSATVGLKRKFTPQWLGTLKVGYIESRSEMTGGNTNFRGPVAYLALEHGL